MYTTDDTFFQDIVNNIPGFVFQLCLKDNGTTIWNHISPKGIEMLGMPEDVVGKEWKLGQRVPEKHRKEFLDSIQQSVKNLSKWEHEFLYTLPDGEQIWLHGIATPRRKGDETILDGIALDISKQKQQEDRVIEEKLYSEKLINSLPGIFYYYNVDGSDFTLQKWNKNHEAITGYSSAELAGKNVYDFFEQAEHSKIKDTLEKLVTQGRVTLEASLKGKNGKTIPYYFESYYFNDKDKPYYLGLGVDISERIEATQSLKESEQKFRKLYTETPVMMHSIDHKGVIITVSDQWLKVMGYKRKEVLGCRSTDFLTDESKKLVQEESMPQLFKSGYINDAELQFKKKNGEIRDILLSAIADKDDQGNVIQSLAVLIDVTKRKAAEEDLERSETMYRTLFSGAGEAIMVISGDYSIKECNLRGLNMFGFNSLDHIIGKRPWDISPEKQPDGRDSINVGRFNLESSKTGAPKTFEWVNKKTDGTLFDAEVSLIKIMLKNGPHFIAIIRDITERKQAEEALRNSEERLKIMFESAPDAIYLIDKKGTYIDANRAAEKMLGYKKEELIGKKLLTLNFLDGKSLPKAVKALGYNVLGKSTGPDEFLLNRKDGSQVPVEISTHPVTIKDKNVILGIAHDITKRKRTENLLLEEKKFSDAMINSLPGIFYVYEDYQRLVQWNSNHETMTGYSSKELKNKSPWDFFVNENKEKAIKAIELVVKNGKVDVELELLNKNGTLTPYHFTGTRFNMNNRDYFCGFGLDITERRKTEKDLETYREHLEELVKERTEELGVSGLELKKLSEAVEQSYATVVITDRDGNIEFANPNFTRTTGYSIEEALHQNPRILKSGEMPDSHYKAMWDTIISGEKWKGDFLNKKKNGEFYWESAIISPIKNELGEITHFVAVKEDISERKKAEEELRIFREFAESSSEGFGMADLSTQILYMNKRLCDMLEINEIAVNESFRKFYTEEAVTLLANKIIPETQTRGHWQGELDLLTSKGNILPTYHNFFLIKDENEQPIRVASVITDITKRKQIEEELGQFKSFADTTTEGFGMAELGGHILYQNKALNDLLEEKKTPYGIPILNYFTTESKELFKKEIERSLSKKGRWQGEMTILSARRNVVPVYMNLFVLKNTTGEPERLAAVLQDITRRKEIEAELQKSKENAEAANRAKSEFLANMSHEIRTPMNSVLGFAEILAGKVTDPKHKSFLDSIQSSGKGLLTLINDILDLSKVEAGKLELSYDSLRVEPFFNDIINIFRLKIEEKGLDFLIDIDSDLPKEIHIDELRTRQIIINLLSNAVKFTKKGFIRFTVSQEPQTVDSINLIVKVEDTGIGISKTFLTNIFDTFQQEDGQISRKFGGTGLGLAISKRLANMLNGDIKVSSKRGEGSEFTLILNQVKISHVVRDIAESDIIRPDQIVFQESTILIADDNEDIRKYFVEVLLENNLKTILAENGKKAFQKAKQIIPDLIITDLKMPVMDGFELVEKLKSDAELREVPVIAVSASVMKEAISKIKSYNFDGFLVKPIVMQDLFVELRKFLPHKLNEREPVVLHGAEEDITVEYTEADIVEILKKLEDEFLDKWSMFKTKQPMNEVQGFGIQLKELGDKCNVSLVSKYGDQLLKSINNFDIENMQKILKDFPKIIDKLKSFI